MRGNLLKWGRRAVVDVKPLRVVPGYRWLFFGLFFQQAGRQLTVVAVPFQVFELTGSTLAVGLLGLTQLIPLLLVSLVGGALADSVDRRRLLSVSQAILALTGLGLLWNAAADTPLLWPLFVLSGLNAGVSAIDSPARQALLPGLVGRQLLPSTLALNQTLGNVAKAAVPAAGGLLIATAGLPSSYAVVAVMFVSSSLLFRRLPDLDVQGGRARVNISSIIDGVRYLRSRRLIQAALLIDLNAMVFGMPTALFPAVGTQMLNGDAFTVGLLYAAPGAGALFAALTSGWVASVRRHGRAVVVAVMGWGMAIAVFGLTSSTTLAVTMLAVAGAADVVSAIFRNTIVQMSTPDALRGRLMSIHMAVVAGGPRLGDLEAGVVASLASIRFSVVSGGLVCVLGALAIARWAPSLAAYTYQADDSSGPDLGEGAEP